MRDGCHFCLACRKWATPEHLENDKHRWRASEWEKWWEATRSVHGEKLEAARSVPGSTAARGAAGAGLADGQQQQQQQPAPPPPPQPVEARVAEVRKKRGQKTAAAAAKEPETVLVLEVVGDGQAPGTLPLWLFAAWPLAPGEGDVLLVAPKGQVQAELPGLPRLKEARQLTPEELLEFVSHVERRCEGGADELVACCQLLVENCRAYLAQALSTDDVKLAGPLLRALRAVARETEVDAKGSPQWEVLSDAVAGHLIQSAAPALLERGDLDVQLCEELAEQLLALFTGAIQQVKALMKAAMQAKAAEALAKEPKGNGEDLPAHWATTSFPSQGWVVVPVAKEDPTFASLKAALATDGAHLGLGRDVLERGSYKQLVLRRAWRVENPGLWKRYSVERQRILQDIQQRKLALPKLEVRGVLQSALSGLPSEPLKEVNEAMLLHGTKPGSVLTLLQNGLNERFSGGLFGHGSYLAEDAGKNDQYVQRDPGPDESGELQDLHSRLFSQGTKHPGNVYYIFVCRVVLGVFVRTRGGDPGAKDLDRNKCIWAGASRRELAQIPGTKPPVHYHSLVAELGEHIHRYREFIQFHDSRLYPEYLLAYQRHK